MATQESKLTELEDGGAMFEFPDELEAKKAASAEKDTVDEIEIVDDVPLEDRGRKASAPPDDPTEDELKSYSEKVQTRIKGFTKGYHDERRAKEAATRERDEALRVAQAVVEENKRLKGTLSQGNAVLLDTTKKAIDAEVAEAKRVYREAVESFDADKIADAQEALTAAKIKQDRIENFRPAPLQEEKKVVQTEQRQPEQPQVDPKARAWAEKNPWWGKDREMTSFTLGLHEKLVVEERLDPRSDEYYERINKRLRQVFPENFEGAAKEKGDPPQRSSVVAPASRSTAPKKITLTQTQVALAKKLGVPLELYAKQVAKEQRNQNG
jgi:hypothetical protein